MRKLLLGLWVVGICGCEPALVSEPRDGGSASDRSRDGGKPDAGVVDGGPGDAGPVDAGVADAGPHDAGGPDSGELDAGPVDAGPDDAGQEDAGPVDAGSFSLDAGPVSARLTARPLGSTTAPNGFFEYLPPGYGDGVPRPLMVFWHGIGEDGNGTTDLGKVLANGPPHLISVDQWPADRPYIVLSPQQPWGCPSSAQVSDFITWARATYVIDAKRVVLTGLSCGAIGSWDYLGDHAIDGGIAAALFSSGDPRDPALASSVWGRQGCALGSVAIWAFHGTADSVVPIQNEAETMSRLLACPSRRDARFTEIDGGGHNVWTDMYAGATGDVYGWLAANPLP